MFWRSRIESNYQPAVLETAALPIELLLYNGRLSESNPLHLHMQMRSACARAAYKEPKAGLEPAPQGHPLPGDRLGKNQLLRIVNVTRVKCPPLCLSYNGLYNPSEVLVGHFRGILFWTHTPAESDRPPERSGASGVQKAVILGGYNVQNTRELERKGEIHRAMGVHGQLPVADGAMRPLRLRGRRDLVRMDGIKPPRLAPAVQPSFRTPT